MSRQARGRCPLRGGLETGGGMENGLPRLTVKREELADHGRPGGGRQGGELSAGKRISA